MTGFGGILILGREALSWFAQLAVPSKVTVVTIALSTAGVGVAVVAPDALPISPFTSSHVVSGAPMPSTVTKTALPINPSIVAGPTPTTLASSAPSATRPTSVAPTMPGAGPSTAKASAASSKASKAATTKRTTASPSASASTVYYKDCEDAWEAGAAPIPRNKPGYRVELDPDLNGVACEKRS